MNTKNINRKGKSLIFLSILFLLAITILFVTSPAPRPDLMTETTSAQAEISTANDSKMNADPNRKITPLSLAIQNYSEAEAKNVDILATIVDVIPAEEGIAPWGNTILVQDGSAKAGVHNINQTDFQDLQLGDWVEIKGGYMQNPENNVVQIFNTESVTVRMLSANNPDSHSR